MEFAETYLHCFGADLKQEDLSSVFCQVCQIGNLEFAKLLISRDINVNGTIYSYTPLLSACEGGHVEIVKLLLSRDDVDCKVKVYDKNALHLACEKGHVEVVRLLIEAGDFDLNENSKGKDALHLAYEGGHAEVARLLIDGGADFDVKDVTLDGRWGSIFGGACSKGQAEMVEFLLGKGVDPNTIDAMGNTALHVACKNGKAGVVEVLVKRKDLDINVKCKEGNTALHYAANPKTVKALFSRNDLDLFAKDNEGSTGFYCVYQRSNKCDLLKVALEVCTTQQLEAEKLFENEKGKISKTVTAFVSMLSEMMAQ